VLAVFTMGFGVTPVSVTAIVTVAVLAGVTYGLWSSRPKKKSPVQPVASPVQPVASPAQPVADPLEPVVGLAWGTLGLILSVGIMMIALRIASFYRGPIIGVWELGTPRYALDQQQIDTTAGLAIAATGWALGVGMFLVRRLHGLAIGLILGTTLLGIFVAIRK
jgi:hypothetical protein